MNAQLQTGTQLVKNAIDAIRALRKNGARSEYGQIYPLLYKPDPRIADLIKKVQNYRNKTTKTPADRQEAGRLFERLATMVFKSISGCNSIKSFSSAGPQYDIVVRGSDVGWRNFLDSVSIRRGRSLVVEVKATEPKVSDAVFSRLSALVTHSLPQSAALGVFFTLEGATGFPPKGAKPQHKIGQARLRQVLLFARHRRPVIVFDWDDIVTLDRPGSLLQLIDDKIVDIEELTGLKVTRVNGNEVLLTLPHLADLSL